MVSEQGWGSGQGFRADAAGQNAGWSPPLAVAVAVVSHSSAAQAAVLIDLAELSLTKCQQKGQTRYSPFRAADLLGRHVLARSKSELCVLDVSEGQDVAPGPLVLTGFTLSCNAEPP